MNSEEIKILREIKTYMMASTQLEKSILLELKAFRREKSQQ